MAISFASAFALIGSLVHPAQAAPVPPAIATSAPTAGNVYADQIRPLLAERCVSCHGESKKKGGLALHIPEAILKGGEDGSVLITGKSGQSEIVRRLRLPLTDDGHMPPQSKPQLSQEQIQTIETWIAAGAVFTGPVASAPANGTAPLSNLAKPSLTEPVDEPGPPDPAALKALQEHLVHVEAISRGSNRLRVDFAAAAAQMTEVEVAKLLTPVLPQLEILSLARCPVGEETANLLARAPRLRHLDLRATHMTDTGVAALSRLSSLRELVLVQTRLTDAVALHLAGFAGLQRVYLWKSGLSVEVIARLRQQRPRLQVDTGDSREATTREAESDLKFSSDAPPPGQVSPTAPPQSQPTAGLQPINTTCPVSGKPVDPRYTIVFRGRTIGFCCPNCPGQFWADPAKFESKLPSSQPASASNTK